MASQWPLNGLSMASQWLRTGRLARAANGLCRPSSSASPASSVAVDADRANRDAGVPRAFGEEFGRDDQFISILGGGYGVWKASLYNNDIPHNYSFNALTPLWGTDGTVLQGVGLPYPQSTNPAVWNQLANYYGHNGDVTNAFAHYAEAIRLDPTEPVYYQNFATTVYLFRKDAQEFYRITEPQVFDKALDLYRKAMKLNPDSFVLATDYAESYYGIKPWRTMRPLPTDCKLQKQTKYLFEAFIHFVV